MKMPSRADYADTNLFLHDLNKWMAASEAAYQHLRGMYEATLPSPDTADWVKRPSGIINHVTVDNFTESDLEPALRNLAGYSFDRGMMPIRICHGNFEKNGKYWGCYIEVAKEVANAA